MREIQQIYQTLGDPAPQAGSIVTMMLLSSLIITIVTCRSDIGLMAITACIVLLLAFLKDQYYEWDIGLGEFLCSQVYAQVGVLVCASEYSIFGAVF